MEQRAPSPRAEPAWPLAFALPWPPSVNNYWRTAMRKISGRWQPWVMLSAAGESYRQRAQLAILMQHVPRISASGSLAVAIVAYPPDRGPRDLDNLLKPVLDALASARVIENDRFVDDLHVRRGPVVKGGRLELAVSYAKPGG